MAGIAPDKTFVHVNFVGGGFGRRGSPDETVQAVAVAKALGKPVKLIWTREQDITHDRYRPQAATKWRARVDESGKVDALEVKVAVASLLRGLGAGGPNFGAGVEPMAVECIGGDGLQDSEPQRGRQPDQHPCAGVLLPRRGARRRTAS
ncbi:MAG: molybdopterin cofactor-binding domain-containing protein [Caulobacteraceae bacterium]